MLGGDKLHPIQPSLDRIDSSKPYDAQNIRLVCLAVNYCMRQWGESVFRTVAAATVSKYLLKMATGYSSSAKLAETR